jgi:hypothetical protein
MKKRMRTPPMVKRVLFFMGGRRFFGTGLTGFLRINRIGGEA